MSSVASSNLLSDSVLIIDDLGNGHKTPPFMLLRALNASTIPGQDDLDL